MSLKKRIIGTLPPPATRALRSAKNIVMEKHDNDTVLRGDLASDEAIFTAASAATTRSRGTVILASTGVSNIGDQAMLDAALAMVPGPVTVVTRSDSTYRIEREDVAERHTAAAVYGRGAPREQSVKELASLILSAENLCIIGADIVDGGYQRGVAYRTWSLARAAALAGINTRIFGFSWGSNIDPLIADVASKAVDAGVQAMCRDSVSHSRFTADTKRNAELVADLVFTLKTPPHTAATLDIQKNYAVVNVSGLIASRVNLTKDYVEVCRHLATLGYFIVLLPHVTNPGGDDRQAIAGVAKALSSEGIEHHVVHQLCSPAEIASIARHASLVVTGRMHLSILSMNNGTPAIVLGTQGKVEGLLLDVGVPQFLVQPHPGMAADIIEALGDIHNNRDDIARTLEEGVGTMRERAQGNAEGLVQ